MVWLLAGCTSPTPDRVEEVSGHLLPAPSASLDAAGRVATTSRTVRVEWSASALAATDTLDAVLPLLHVDGRPLDQLLPSGLMRLDKPPTFAWSSERPVQVFPFVTQMELPDDSTTWLAAWVDRDGDARLSEGDPVSAPAPPPNTLAGENPVLSLVIDRIYHRPAEDELLATTPEVVTVKLASALRVSPLATLLVQGYPRAEGLVAPWTVSEPVLR